MKKIFFSLLAVVALFSCSQNNESNESKVKETKSAEAKALSPMQEFEATIKDLEKKGRRRGSNKDSLKVVYDNYLKEMSQKHAGDSLGLTITQSMAVAFTSKQIDSVLNVCELYKNDPTLQNLYHAAVAAEATAVGKKYIDVKGINVANDKAGLTLSSVVAKGKPVLVNFWNSANVPSRDVIRTYLFPMNDEYKGKVNFCSIAVWEDSITFVHRATDELMIDWPSIYTEGRENSPTDAYGVTTLPFVMLIGRDGVIKARGIKAEEIKDVLDAELK